MINADCRMCGNDLEKKGAILWGVPIDGYPLAIDGEVCEKTHLCTDCYKLVMGFIERKSDD